MKTKQQIEEQINSLREEQEKFLRKKDEVRDIDFYNASVCELNSITDRIHLLEWVLHES
ncbi:MAG: hypothetical protein RSC45_12630 [Acinetobacter sp.]